MTYNADDVHATLNIYKAMWPDFRSHFPSPVTFAGMLEMGTAYLPVNSNWSRYVELSEQHYRDAQVTHYMVVYSLYVASRFYLLRRSRKNWMQ